jgi:hypothetical protein
MPDTTHRWELERSDWYCHFVVYTDRCVWCEAKRFVVHEFEPDENTLQRFCRRCDEIRMGYVLNAPWEAVRKPVKVEAA